MKIVRPGDKDYDDDRRISNARFNYKPSLICYCEEEDDVIEALRMAKGGEYAVRVRAGGHQHEGMCSGDGVLMVDVSNLNKIDVDFDRLTVRVGPGAKLKQIYTAVLSEGLLFPGGACGDVHVGGLVQGGGWGLFSRGLGLTCDWLDRFTMVTWYLNEKREEDFHAVDVMGAASDPNKDLYWAVCGGGGGNFGVATEFVFKVVPYIYSPGNRPKSVTQFSATWSDRNCAASVLDEWMTRFPNDDEFRLTTFCRLIAPGTESTDKPTLILGNFVGEQDELELNLRRLLPRNFSSAEIEYSQVAVSPPPPSPATAIFSHPKYQPGAPGATQDLSDTCSGAYFRHKVSSAYPRADFGSAATEMILKHINGVTPLSGARRYISFHSLGGVVKGDGSREIWSCFAYRDKPFLMQYQAWWDDKNLDGKCLDWLCRFRDDMRPYTEGAFINFPDRDLVDNATDRKSLMRPYYGKNFDELIRIKNRYDPNNVFDFPMGIPVR